MHVTPGVMVCKSAVMVVTNKIVVSSVCCGVTIILSNSYTMGCPPVRGDNPRALASGLSYVQVDKHGKLFYTTYISVDLAQHEIFRAKVGKGGIQFSTTEVFGQKAGYAKDL